MATPAACDIFVKRFMDLRSVERYRDRYRTGRHARVDRLERAALRQLLTGLGRFEVALDLPCGTGRLSDTLAETCDRVIMADASPIMLQVAQQETHQLKATYLLSNAEHIQLPARSVDLVFCHRLLNHVPDTSRRGLMFRELARVSRRYVVVSCYPAGPRTRLKLLARKLIGTSISCHVPASRSEVIEHAAQSGLRLSRTAILRRFPFTAELLLFEHLT